MGIVASAPASSDNLCPLLSPKENRGMVDRNIRMKSRLLEAMARNMTEESKEVRKTAGNCFDIISTVCTTLFLKKHTLYCAEAGYFGLKIPANAGMATKFTVLRKLARQGCGRV